MHVFPCRRIEALTIEPDGEPLARLLGTSCDAPYTLRPGDFSPDASGLYTIAIAFGDADATALYARGIPFWALGGRHSRSTVEKEGRSWSGEVPAGPLIHYCGSPQGRCPEETGVHGCTLVQVDAQRQAHTSLIPTDAVRWFNERVLADEAMLPEDLESRLRQRVDAIIEASRSAASLISWTIAGQGPIVAQLRRGALAASVLQSLRNDYGHRSSPVWSASLDIEWSETLPPEWYEQETIRGDFLRAVRQLQMNPDEPLVLDAFIAELHLAGALAAAATIEEGTVRQHVLRATAALGGELLSAEEARK